jgi:hypothetical protein
LTPGDVVLVRPQHRKKKGVRTPRGYRQAQGLKHHPFAIKCTVRMQGRSRTIHVVQRHRLVAEAALNDLAYGVFLSQVRMGEVDGLLFLDPKKVDVHHKDHDTTNNRPDNLEVLPRKKHRDLHRREAVRRVRPQAVPSTICSIEPAGEEETYDLTMRAPLNSYVANDFVVHNSGKSLMAIAASVLVDSRRTLIVGPAIARLPWAEEVTRWTGEEALLLYGRGAREARRYCAACSGKGELAAGPEALGSPDGGGDGGGGELVVPCAACRQRNGQSYGYRLFDVPAVRAEVLRTPAGARYCRVGGRFLCRKHPEVEAPSPWFRCGKCHAELIAALRRARFVIVNYELLVRQHHDAGGGRLAVREDLEGWVPTLKKVGFDVAVLDEIHQARGWTTATKREGERRNERVLELVGTGTGVGDVPRVWGLTGTLFCGFVRDAFWPLEIISGGLFNGSKVRGLRFMERYCGGRRGEFGYEANGRTGYAEVELKRRLEGTREDGPSGPGTGRRRFDGIMIQRSRAELFAHVPPAARRVVRLELPGLPSFVPGQRSKAALGRAIRAVSAKKRDAVLSELLDEIAEGNRIMVLCFHKESAKATFLAIEKGFRQQRVRMEAVNAKAWLSTGQDAVGSPELDAELVQSGVWARSADARYAQAEAFRAHIGGGAMVGTIDAFPGALSLRGAVSVHFLDLHWSPAAMAQAEDRPWHPDIKDFSVVYYHAVGSVDDHLAAVVLPKVETLVRMAREESAEAMLAAFAGDDAERTFDAVWDRLVAHLGRGGEGGTDELVLDAENDGAGLDDPQGLG